MTNTKRRARALEVERRDEEDEEKMKIEEDARDLGLRFGDSPTRPEPSARDEAREPTSEQRTRRQAPLDRRRVAAEE
jgi:hypothetical protein